MKTTEVTIHKVTFKDAEGKRRKGTVTVTDKALLFEYKASFAAKQMLVMLSAIGAVTEHRATMTLHLVSGQKIEVTASHSVIAAIRLEMAQ